MLKKYGFVKKSTNCIEKAIKLTLEDFRNGDVSDEPAITNRMLGAIKLAMNDCKVKGIHWRAKTLKSLVRNSEEHEFGADFAGILKIDLPDFKETKGFLAQAKIVKPQMSKEELLRLHKQCYQMLEVTQQSFVFLYSSYNVRIVSANCVISTQNNPMGCYSQSSNSFFEGYLKSSIGDRRIVSSKREDLEEILKQNKARELLYLEATSE
jgi:hypothetical protein